jgi:small subunit ribosomal protein S12
MRKNMTTLNQLIFKPRKIKKKLNTKKALNKCPQKLAICNKIRIMSPKKPNSAQRQVARVKIVSTNQFITVYISGEGHSLQQYSNVLIRGGRVRDLPGIRYKIIRGNLDAMPPVDNKRNQRRSKFGIPKLKEKINVKISTKKS